MTDVGIAGRIEKLERDNRLLKASVLGAFLLSAVLLLMGVARTNRTVTANKFVLLDREGRARLTISTPAFAGIAPGLRSDDPAIWIDDKKGTDRAILTADGITFGNEHGREVAGLTAREGSNPSLKFFGHATHNNLGYFPRIDMQLDRTGLSIAPASIGNTDNGIWLHVTGKSAQLRVAGDGGFETVVNGTSLVMFGNTKKHHVIWQAP